MDYPYQVRHVTEPHHDEETIRRRAHFVEITRAITDLFLKALMRPRGRTRSAKRLHESYAKSAAFISGLFSAIAKQSNEVVDDDDQESSLNTLPSTLARRKDGRKQSYILPGLSKAIQTMSSGQEQGKNVTESFSGKVFPMAYHSIVTPREGVCTSCLEPISHNEESRQPMCFHFYHRKCFDDLQGRCAVCVKHIVDVCEQNSNKLQKNLRKPFKRKEKGC